MSSFCKCKCKSYSHFCSKNISIYAIFNNQSFNDKLTTGNDILSFEQLGPNIYLMQVAKMSEETRGLAIKDKVEVNDNSRKISVEESTSQVGQTVVQDEKVCQSIVFDNEQMKSSKFTVERSSCRSKVTREQTTLSENTSGNDSNLLIFAVHQRNTEVELASSGTEGPVADLAQVANNQEVHDKRTSLETQTALRSVLDNCSTSSQNDTCGGPDFDRRCQTITVSKGKAITDKFSGEICNFSDFEHSSRDGLFWKLSEFHRRSGKQGLESRFELLSPTIIVDCSAFFRDQGKTITLSLKHRNKEVQGPEFSL